MNSNLFLIAITLMSSLCPNTGIINLTTSKRLSSLKPFDQTKLFQPFKIGLLNKWEKDLSFLLPSILLNAIKIQVFKLLSSSCCLLVQIQSQISFVLLKNPEWVREFSLFHSVKAKERKLVLWLMTMLRREAGCFCRTAIWQSVGCLNLKS